MISPYVILRPIDGGNCWCNGVYHLLRYDDGRRTEKVACDCAK